MLSSTLIMQCTINIFFLNTDRVGPKADFINVQSDLLSILSDLLQGNLTKDVRARYVIQPCRRSENIQRVLGKVVDCEPLPRQSLVFTCLQYQSFENTVGKGEIARNEQFLFFPTVFSILSGNFPPFSPNLKLSSANSFSLEFVVWERVK